MGSSRCNGGFPGHFDGMNLVAKYRANANDCAFLAGQAGDEETKRAFTRMETAWRTLAQEQERLCKRAKKPPM
jgi:hypothetical protein